MIEFDKQISRKDTESVNGTQLLRHIKWMTYFLCGQQIWTSCPGGVAKAFSEYIKHGIFGYASV